MPRGVRDISVKYLFPDFEVIREVSLKTRKTKNGYEARFTSRWVKIREKDGKLYLTVRLIIDEP